MAYYYASEKNRRSSNEDSFCQMEIRMNHEAPVTGLAVADGMGGMEGGKYFSDQAVKIWFGQLAQTLMGDDFCGQSLRQQEETLKTFAGEVYGRLGRLLYKQGMDRGLRGGTTLSAVILFWDTFYISNCGDSPIYVMKDGELKLVSELQNAAGQMVRDGKTKPGSLRYRQNRNLLMEYMGGREPGIPYVTEIAADKVDYLIMGSDGAFGELSPREIGEILLAHPPKDVLPRLFDEVRKSGETDNQTAILYVKEGQADRPDSGSQEGPDFFNLSSDERSSRHVLERLKLWRDSYRKE